MSKRRFVKEYAYDKARALAALAKEHPQNAEACRARIGDIGRAVYLWNRGMIIADEAMRLIADA